MMTLFFFFSFFCHASLVVPDLIKAELDNATLVAEVEILQRKSEEFENSIETKVLAKILSIEKDRSSRLNIGDSIEIVVPGGEVNGIGLILSGYPRLYNYRKYKVHLVSYGEDHFKVVGMDYGVHELGSTRKITRNRTDGSDGAGTGPYLFWHKDYFPIPYYISLPTFEGFVSAADAINNSFKTWRDPKDVSIEFIPMGCTNETQTKNDGINNIILVKDSWSPKYDGSAVAITRNYYVAGESYYAGRILDTDILLNAVNFHFTTTGESGKYDVQNVVTHEIGHLIGIGHDVDPDQNNETTMYPKTEPGETKKRTLEEEDLSVLREAYGGINTEKSDSFHSGFSCDLTDSRIGCANTHKSYNKNSLKFIFFLLIITLFHFFFRKSGKATLRIFF